LIADLFAFHYGAILYALELVARPDFIEMFNIQKLISLISIRKAHFVHTLPYLIAIAVRTSTGTIKSVAIRPLTDGFPIVNSLALQIAWVRLSVMLLR
jgi:hypothetical protein